MLAGTNYRGRFGTEVLPRGEAMLCSDFGDADCETNGVAGDKADSESSDTRSFI